MCTMPGSAPSGAQLLVHGFHAAERRAGDGAAVVAVPARNDDVAFRLAEQLPVAAHQADHGVVRFAAGAGVEHVVELRRRHFRENSRKLDRRRGAALEETVVVRQLQHLAVGGVGEFLAPVAERHAPQAGHAVEDLVALGRVDVHALGARDDARAARGQCLEVGEWMQVVRAVQSLPVRCRGLLDLFTVAPLSDSDLRRSAAGARAPRS